MVEGKSTVLRYGKVFHCPASQPVANEKFPKQEVWYHHLSAHFNRQERQVFMEGTVGLGEKSQTRLFNNLSVYTND